MAKPCIHKLHREGLDYVITKTDQAIQILAQHRQNNNKWRWSIENSDNRSSNSTKTTGLASIELFKIIQDCDRGTTGATIKFPKNIVKDDEIKLMIIVKHTYEANNRYHIILQKEHQSIEELNKERLLDIKQEIYMMRYIIDTMLVIMSILVSVYVGYSVYACSASEDIQEIKIVDMMMDNNYKITELYKKLDLKDITTAPRSDNRCGEKYNNARCGPNLCCSAYYWCYNTSDHCENSKFNGHKITEKYNQ